MERTNREASRQTTLEEALALARRGRRDGEKLAERWRRFYRAERGPLWAWLLDEAAERNLDAAKLGGELGVTAEHLTELHEGSFDMAGISREFAAACGVYLGVPTVVVLIVAGCLKLVDFVVASDFDHWIENTVSSMGPRVRQLSCGAEVGPDDLRLLPDMVAALRNGAVVHESRSRMR